MTLVWVLDTETTGVDPDVDEVVEVAGVLLDTRSRSVVDRYTSLVKPNMSVPPAASAVHHLTDAHLVDAPTLEEALGPVLSRPTDYVVAHNAKFDASFLPQVTGAWVCTWKLSNRVWAQAPSYGNQVLRYWLNLVGPSDGTHAHRALYDAEVTAQIFVELLTMASSDDPLPKMAEVSAQPVLLRRVAFGQHRDKPWSELPRSYLQWVVRSTGFDENVAHTARHWLDKS